VSDYSAIHETTIELRRQIFEAFETTADADFGLDGDISRITLKSPGDDLDDSAIASLYLYRIDVDEHLRNQRPLPDAHDANLFHRPPMPLQLHYLFTPVDDREQTNQLLLGRLVQHLHDSPCFATFSGEPIGDSHGGASPELRVVPDMLSLEQATQIWTAFSVPYRTALSLRVEVLAIDSARAPEPVPRAQQLVVAAGRARWPS
jgi:hypothetical protein